MGFAKNNKGSQNEILKLNVKVINFHKCNVPSLPIFVKESIYGCATITDDRKDTCLVIIMNNYY